MRASKTKSPAVHHPKRPTEAGKHAAAEATKKKTTTHVADSVGDHDAKSAAYQKKVGDGVAVARQGKESEQPTLSRRINDALGELGINGGIHVGFLTSGDWLDSPGKVQRMAQVEVLTNPPATYLLESRAGPDRLVLRSAEGGDTLATARLSDFHNFTAAVKAVMSEPIAGAKEVVDAMIREHSGQRAPQPAHPAPASRELSPERKQLLGTEVQRLSQEVRTLKGQLDELTRGYGYTAPWALDKSRDQFTLVNGRFDVLGYERHLKTVEADKTRYGELKSRYDEKRSQLDLKATELKTGLASNVD